MKTLPSQNAQRYAKLYQKARSAKRLAAEQVEKTTEELDYLEGQMLNLSACEEESELAELREELEKYGYVRKNHNRRQMKKLEPSKPMRFDSPTGIPILVGKNNLQNDKLTSTAEPNEWWLHAKDMPGSHVIVLSADPDEATLHMAARLAARYSKGASAGKVPIDMTRRRYVKKPAGAKPGFGHLHQQRRAPPAWKNQPWDTPALPETDLARVVDIYARARFHGRARAFFDQWGRWMTAPTASSTASPRMAP